MYASTSPYKRKDGTSARHYVCAQVHGETGACDMPKVNAATVDDWVTRYLRAILKDFDRFFAALRDTQSGDLARARDTLAAQLAELDDLDAEAGVLEAEYVSRLRAGDRAAADVLVRRLERQGTRRKALEA
jgi:hypothetical protein